VLLHVPLPLYFILVEHTDGLNSVTLKQTADSQEVPVHPLKHEQIFAPTQLPCKLHGPVTPGQVTILQLLPANLSWQTQVSVAAHIP